MDNRKTEDICTNEEVSRDKDCPGAPNHVRPPRQRATSEERDPSYMPFILSKRWIPANQNEDAESNRRFNQKWTLQQTQALEDGVRM